MDVSARVKMKSDRRARALIMAFCVLPVTTPLLAAGVNSLFASPEAATTPIPTASTFEVSGQRPLLRASLDMPEAPSNPLLSPEPMAAQAGLETSLAAVAAARPRSLARVEEQAPRARPAQDAPKPDGFQVNYEGLLVSLAGIGPAPQGSECKRLDGVVEPCTVRAANRLDILTRGRQVVCDLQKSDGGTRGVCRAGKIDLAEDLVRNGLAVRTTDRL